MGLIENVKKMLGLGQNASVTDTVKAAVAEIKELDDKLEDLGINWKDGVTMDELKSAAEKFAASKGYKVDDVLAKAKAMLGDKLK